MTTNGDVIVFEFYRRAAGGAFGYGHFDTIVADVFGKACERFAATYPEHVEDGDSFVVTGPIGSSVERPQARVFTIDLKPRWREDGDR